jgi:hypothetical protein
MNYLKHGDSDLMTSDLFGIQGEEMGGGIQLFENFQKARRPLSRF